jgi:hypothetical protein
MITVEEYIKKHGCKVSDFTEEELKEIKDEVGAINAGGCILDGFFEFRTKYIG